MFKIFKKKDKAINIEPTKYFSTNVKKWLYHVTQTMEKDIEYYDSCATPARQAMPGTRPPPFYSKPFDKKIRLFIDQNFFSEAQASDVKEQNRIWAERAIANLAAIEFLHWRGFPVARLARPSLNTLVTQAQTDNFSEHLFHIRHDISALQLYLYNKLFNLTQRYTLQKWELEEPDMLTGGSLTNSLSDDARRLTDSLDKAVAVCWKSQGNKVPQEILSWKENSLELKAFLILQNSNLLQPHEFAKSFKELLQLWGIFEYVELGKMNPDNGKILKITWDDALLKVNR